MCFTRPQDYVDALKELEGFPLMGLDVKDDRLVFTSLSSHVAVPLRNKAEECGCGVVRYGLNKLDVFVSCVKYDDCFKDDAETVSKDEKGGSSTTATENLS